MQCLWVRAQCAWHSYLQGPDITEFHWIRPCRSHSRVFFFVLFFCIWKSISFSEPHLFILAILCREDMKKDSRGSIVFLREHTNETELSAARTNKIKSTPGLANASSRKTLWILFYSVECEMWETRATWVYIWFWTATYVNNAVTLVVRICDVGHRMV